MMFSKSLFAALSLLAFASPSILGAPGRSCSVSSTITITADASSTAAASNIAVTSPVESSVAVPSITSIAGGSKNEDGSNDSSDSNNSGNGDNDGGSSLTTSARNNVGTTLSESTTASTLTNAEASDTISTASSIASVSSGGSKTCPARSTITVTATATTTSSSGSSGGSQNGGGSNDNSGSSSSNSGSDGSSTSTGRNSAATTTSGGGKDNGSGNGDNDGNDGTTSISTSDDSDATSTSRGQNNAASSTTSATATATSGSGSSSGTNTDDDQQSATTLNSAAIATGFASDGQEVPAEGQVASLTSTNNFINFCLTVNKPITNGQQIKTGSCNPAPMGVIAATTNMPSSKFQFPKNGETISANQAFTIKMAINNIETGNFVNAQSNYYSAPQQVNSQGNIIGHSHVVIEQLDSLNQTTPTDPTKFAFFKGINGAAVNGVVTADVTDGLPAGFYRLASINAAANHQPVLVAVAQHGTLDDMVYFTVQ